MKILQLMAYELYSKQALKSEAQRAVEQLIGLALRFVNQFVIRAAVPTEVMQLINQVLTK
jgi:hypothetical protein